MNNTYIELEQVTKEEFDDFIDKYPKELIGHTQHIVDPPQYQVMDFSLAEYPYNIVATVTDDWANDRMIYKIMKDRKNEV